MLTKTRLLVILILLMMLIIILYRPATATGGMEGKGDHLLVMQWDQLAEQLYEAIVGPTLTDQSRTQRSSKMEDTIAKLMDNINMGRLIIKWEEIKEVAVAVGVEDTDLAVAGVITITTTITTTTMTVRLFTAGVAEDQAGSHIKATGVAAFLSKVAVNTSKVEVVEVEVEMDTNNKHPFRKLGIVVAEKKWHNIIR